MPQWFVVGFPRPSGAWRPPVHPSISLRANGPTAPPLDPGFRRDGDGGDWRIGPTNTSAPLTDPATSGLRVRGRATTRVAPTGANVGNHGEVPGVLLFEGNS